MFYTQNLRGFVNDLKGMVPSGVSRAAKLVQVSRQAVYAWRYKAIHEQFAYKTLLQIKVEATKALIDSGSESDLAILNAVRARSANAAAQQAAAKQEPNHDI